MLIVYRLGLLHQLLGDLSQHPRVTGAAEITPLLLRCVAIDLWSGDMLCYSLAYCLVQLVCVTMVTSFTSQTCLDGCALLAFRYSIVVITWSFQQTDFNFRATIPLCNMVTNCRCWYWVVTMEMSTNTCPLIIAFLLNTSLTFFCRVFFQTVLYGRDGQVISQVLGAVLERSTLLYNIPAFQEGIKRCVMTPAPIACPN